MDSTTIDEATGIVNALFTPQSAFHRCAQAENVYYPRTTGFVFGTTGVIAHVRMPFYGMIVLSATERPITLRVGSHRVQQHAVAVWGDDVRFEAEHDPYVSIGFNPLHQDFRSFTKIRPPHAIALDARWYASLQPLIARAIDGSIAHEEALQLLDVALERTREHLPAVPPFDKRAQLLTRLLWENPRCSLSELAQQLGLSYHRASHAFVESLGVTIRTYQLWQKLYRARVPWQVGKSLTEVAHIAGFVDSAHYSRAFQTAYGRCPTEMFRSRRIEVFGRKIFDEAAVAQNRY